MKQYGCGRFFFGNGLFQWATNEALANSIISRSQLSECLLNVCVYVFFYTTTTTTTVWQYAPSMFAICTSASRSNAQFFSHFRRRTSSRARHPFHPPPLAMTCFRSSSNHSLLRFCGFFGAPVQHSATGSVTNVDSRWIFSLRL